MQFLPLFDFYRDNSFGRRSFDGPDSAVVATDVAAGHFTRITFA
jgi:hypothetical protein